VLLKRTISALSNTLKSSFRRDAETTTEEAEGNGGCQ